MGREINKEALVDSLKIERVPAHRKVISPFIYGAGAAAVIAIAAGAWFFRPDDAVRVRFITVSAVGARGASFGLDASGYVVARRKATLSARIMGMVSEVNFEEGQKVKAGDIVARLDDASAVAAVQQARAELIRAKAALDNAAPFYARYRALSAQGAVSTDAVESQRATYDNARTQYGVTQAQVAVAEANLRDTVVRAPFAGVVTVKVAQVGEVVAPQASGGGDTRTGILTIVDMDSLEVEVDVSENYIERVRIGGDTIIHLEAFPDWDIAGSVIAIIPTAEKSKGTVAVRVAIKSKDARILPQMAARVSFVTSAEMGTLREVPRVRVPISAVLASDGTNRKIGNVFVLTTDDKVEKREVTLGPKTGETVTILSGISVGDRLASDNLDKLHDGDGVKIVN